MSVDRSEIERVMRLLADEGMLAAEHLIPPDPKLSPPPTPRPPDDTPWKTQLALAEDAARRRIARYPTCPVCGGRLTVGQDGIHCTCDTQRGQ